MKLSKYLGDRTFWRIASALAIPVALQNVLSSSFQLVDTMMVSKLGDLTLSAVGMAGQWGWLVNLLGFGLCSGMSVFVAQYWGVKDLKGIRRVLGMGTICSLVLSAAFMLTALLIPEKVVMLFNQDPDVVRVGSRYLTVVCYSYPAVALMNVFSTLLRNTERVRLPMYVSIVTTAVNAVVNYGLIFGRFGMPELGVSGAAIATCISSWLGPILVLAVSLREKNMLVGPLKEMFSFTKQELGAFFARALPVVLNEGMWALGTLVINMIYANIGYEYYAGVTIYSTFANLAFSFYVGLGNACVIMVGKSVGKGKIERGITDALRFSVLTPLTGLLVGACFILLRYPLILIFSTGDNLSALTLKTALEVTIFCSAEVVLRNVPYMMVVGVFRSGGDTVHGMLMDLGCLWLLSIPAALCAANVLHLPFLGVVMAAYLAEDVPKCLLCMRHFISRKWLIPVTPEGQEGLEAYRSGYDPEE